MKIAITTDVLAEIPARLACFSPNKLPMLDGRSSSNTIDLIKLVKGTHRTETATLRAKGAWNVDEAETSNTDCVARATGPSLSRSFHKPERRHAHTDAHKLAATLRRKTTHQQ